MPDSDDDTDPGAGSEGDAADTPAEPTRRSRTLTGLPAVFLVAMVVAVAQSFGRFTIGVLLPAVRDDLGLSNTLAGSLATLNVGAYLVGIILAAVLTSRFRLLAVMRVGMVVAVAGLGLASVAPGSVVLGAALFVMGIGGALCWVPAPVVAAGAMPPEKRATAVGLVVSGMALGVVVSGQLAGFVRSTWGDDAWRTVYLVQFLLGLVVVACAMVLIGHDQAQPGSSNKGGGLDALRRMSGWRPMLCAYTSFGLMYLLVVAFLTTRLEDDSGWTGSRASLAFTVLGVAMLFGGPLFVGIARRIRTGQALALTFGLWAVFSLAILPGAFLPTLGASLMIGLLFAAAPMLFVLYFMENTATQDYGPAFAVATIAFSAAQMLSPQLGGLLADLTGSFAAVFMLSAALAVIGAIASLRLPSPQPESDGS